MQSHGQIYCPSMFGRGEAPLPIIPTDSFKLFKIIFLRCKHYDGVDPEEIRSHHEKIINIPHSDLFPSRRVSSSPHRERDHQTRNSTFSGTSLIYTPAPKILHGFYSFRRKVKLKGRGGHGTSMR